MILPDWIEACNYTEQDVINLQEALYIAWAALDYRGTETRDVCDDAMRRIEALNGGKA